MINAAIQARFVELEAGLPAWPCDFPSAQFVKLKVAATGGMSGAGETADGPAATPKMLVAVADLEPSQVQELGDVTPKLLELKVKSNTPIRFQVRIEIGDGVTMPSAEVARKAKAILRGVKDDLEIDQR